jgi:hypothetical protein
MQEKKHRVHPPRSILLRKQGKVPSSKETMLNICSGAQTCMGMRGTEISYKVPHLTDTNNHTG